MTDTPGITERDGAPISVALYHDGLTANTHVGIRSFRQDGSIAARLYLSPDMAVQLAHKLLEVTTWSENLFTTDEGSSS